MIICRTPFRISFFGGGTDIPAWYKDHGGAVISSSIDKYCYINLRNLPNFFKFNYRLRYFKNEHVKKVSEIKHNSFREIIKYLKYDKTNLEVIHSADLPALSGLGASSSSTVCLLHALNSLSGKFVTKKELANQALDIEQEILKEHVGSQDQIAASFGGLNYIRFYNDLKYQVNPIVNSIKNIEKLQQSLVLVYSGIQRKANNIEKDKTKNFKVNENHLKRLIDITDEALKLFQGNMNIKDLGALLDEQWHIKKNLSTKVSNKIIDEIYFAGKECGAYGGKLLGAGNGGFFLFLCNTQSEKKLRKKLRNFLFIPVKFENSGSQLVYFSRSNINAIK